METLSLWGKSNGCGKANRDNRDMFDGFGSLCVDWRRRTRERDCSGMMANMVITDNRFVFGWSGTVEIERKRETLLLLHDDQNQQIKKIQKLERKRKEEETKRKG